MKNRLVLKSLVFAVLAMFVGTSAVLTLGRNVKGPSSVQATGSGDAEAVLGCGNIVTFYPTDDSYVNPNYPTTNYNDEHRLEVGSYTDPSACRAYLKFDLSSIPSGSVINSATFTLFLEGYGMLPYDVEAHYLDPTVAWNEISINWNTLDIGTFNPVPTDTKTITSGNWYTWDVTSDAQLTVDSVPTRLLNEVLKVAVEYVQFKGGTFTSKEVVGYEPYLTIDYCLPGDVTLNLPTGLNPTASFNLALTDTTSQPLTNVHWQMSWTILRSIPANYPAGSAGGIVNIPPGSVTVASGLLPTPGFFGIVLFRVTATADCATSVTRRGLLVWFGPMERILIF